MHGRSEHDPATPRTSRHDWWGIVLECPDPQALAGFYAALLGWEIAKEGPDDAAVAPPDGVAYLAFQRAESYRPPAWPARADAPRITAHLDFEVGDLAAAAAHARELGARDPGHQPQPAVRVLLDPAGHPFCLYTDPSAG